MALLFSGKAGKVLEEAVCPLCGAPQQEPRAQPLLGKCILKEPEGKAKSEGGKELAFLSFASSCQRLICVSELARWKEPLPSLRLIQSRLHPWARH